MTKPVSMVARLGQWSAEARKALAWPWLWEARWRGVEVEGPVVFLGRPIITRKDGSRIVLRGRNQLASSTRCSGLGNAQPCVLRTLVEGAYLELGAGVGLSSASICAATSIRIGEGTIIGSGAWIFDTDFHLPDEEFGWRDAHVATARPITIGRGCFIGARAIILKGVTIGDRAAVAAGAVVTTRVPPGHIAMGNPARMWPWKVVKPAA